jgi:hypothetical protein
MIFLQFPIELIKKLNGVFTKGRVIDDSIFYSNASELINFNISDSNVRSWKPCMKRVENRTLLNALDASAFIDSTISIDNILSIIVYDEAVKNKVEHILHKYNKNISIKIGDDLDYFKTDYNIFFEEIIGPDEIYSRFSKFNHKMLVMSREFKSNSKSKKFKTLHDLKLALDKSFDCIMETAELVGLDTFNKVHKENVGNHSRTVASNAKITSEYNALPEHYKVLVELAAYLHDIGKGPKIRWRKTDGLQLIDPNHPLRSMYYLERIFKEEIESFSDNDMLLLIKLLCYHDLIGDIAGKGRNISELTRIIKSENELNCLFALSKGDISSINQEWIYSNLELFKSLKQIVRLHLQTLNK